MNVRLTDMQIAKDINYAGVKACKNCEVEYPATEKYFYRAKGNKDGFRCECKRCTDNTNNQRRMKNLKSLDNVKVAEEKSKQIARLELRNDTLSGVSQLEEQERKRLEKQVTDLIGAVGMVSIIAIFVIIALYVYKF